MFTSVHYYAVWEIIRCAAAPDSNDDDVIVVSAIALFLQIKTDRGSMSAEDNILKFLQACHSLGVEKVRYYCISGYLHHVVKFFGCGPHVRD